MAKSPLTTTALLGLGLLVPILVAGCSNDDKPAATDSTAPVTAPATSAPASTPAKIGAEVTLSPALKGRTLTMKVTVAGTVVVPLGGDDHKPLPDDTSFIDLGLGADYTFGDGSEPGGSDGGAVTCEGATKQKTGTQTYEPASPHTFAKPGTYTFTYKIKYCGGPAGQFTATKTAQIVVA